MSGQTVEMPVEEFTILKKFDTTTLANAIDFNDPNMDEALKQEYIQVIQIWNSYGTEAEAAAQSADTSAVAAPGG